MRRDRVVRTIGTVTVTALAGATLFGLSLIHISEPTRPY